MRVMYDAGVFVAAELNDRDVWADHRARLELGLVPLTTAPVVAQVSRSPQQTQLHRMLRGCEVVAFGTDDAYEVGSLLGRAGTTDVVHAHLVITAAAGSATVLSTEPDHIRHLTERLPAQLRRPRI